MSKIVLLAVAAAWAAVLIPPLVRSRVDNRPGSSVSDFRRQLSSLERTVPTRAMGSMRSMARPLTQAPRQRQATARAGQPVRIGQPQRTPTAGRRMHGATLDHSPSKARRDSARDVHMQRVSARELTRRRRTNVLMLLVLTNGATLFLAATTKAHYLVYVFAIAFVALCGYCYKLVQLRTTELDRQYDNWFKAA